MYTFWLCLFLNVGVYTGLCATGNQKQDSQVVKRTTGTRCCGDLGCFSTAYPFTSKERPLSFLPKCQGDIGATYTVFTRRNLHVGCAIEAKNKHKLKRSDFDMAKPTKVIVHGFASNANVGNWMHDMKKAFLIRGDYNVILVDWGKGAKLPYTQATANTRVVGAEIAQLITFLQSNGAQPETFHIVGHSLGAHIAGYAGERLQYLGRITGLDPAEPYYSGTDKVVRLDVTDALFVDVIHTDGDPFFSGVLTLSGGFGMSEPIGHVDFYPNGGEVQPGCDKSFISSIVVDGLFDAGKKFVACSHSRAYKLFTESINSVCPFNSFPCKSYEDFEQGKCSDCESAGCARMGYLADTKKPAKPTSYYLDTAGNFPFCRYHYHVKVTMSSDGREEYGKLYVIIHGTDYSTDEIKLTEKNIYIKPGETYLYMTKQTKILGSLKSIDIRWVRSTLWFNPSHWGFFRTPKLYFSNVVVSPAITAKSTAFCRDTPIKSNERKQFLPCRTA